MGYLYRCRFRCDMAAEQICDLRKIFVTLCYSEDFKCQLSDYVSKLPESLQPFEDFLEGNPWLAGQKITWAGKMSHNETGRNFVLCNSYISKLSLLPNPLPPLSAAFFLQTF